MYLEQLFRLWLGVTEYLFRTPGLLDEVISTAIEDNSFRRDDLEFTFAARVSLISVQPRRFLRGDIEFATGLVRVRNFWGLPILP